MFKENEEVYFIKYNLRDCEYEVLEGTVVKSEGDLTHIKLEGKEDTVVSTLKFHVFKSRKEATKVINKYN